MILRSSLLIFLLTLGVLNTFAENWPAWRGPTGQGFSSEKDLPTEWSRMKNIAWKTPLPGPGNSTPIIWEKKVFLTQASGRDGSLREVWCIDRDSGKVLWKSGTSYTEEETTHKTNPQCSGSPVTDGELVVASFASAGLFCFDMDGRELWHRDLGKQTHIWGNGASPVLHEDLVLLNFGPGPNTALIALDRKTGETRWRMDEPGGRSGLEPKKPGENNRNVWVGSWSSPVPVTQENQTYFLMTYPGRMFAFEPTNGKEIWNATGLNPLVYTSPIHNGEIAVAMGGFQGDTIAVKLGGSGDVTTSHKLWEHKRTKQRIGSGVIHEGHIYILNDPGIAECFELKTGNRIWEERLRGPGPTSQNWSSMVLADGHLYAINQGGDAFVFKASPTFGLVATNSLREKTIGSIAISNQKLFIRTHKALWCVAK